MDMLCTDKTGTLTEGVVRLDGALDLEGKPSTAVLRYTYLNAHYQTGLSNPLDEAINTYAQKAGLDIGAEQKVDEIPYDFVRKRLSVVTADAQGERTLITKGALDNILSICKAVQAGEEVRPLDDARRAGIEGRYSDWSGQGFRVLGVATKALDGRPDSYAAADETDLTFAGFLLFFDPPKVDVRQTIIDLAQRGVQLKIITGDNQKVARHVAEAVSLPVTGLLTGSALNDMRDEALWHAAERTTIFAEVDPNQKERIILALRKTGHVVGYMGDGINDAPALHAADVGISVDTAVDVAKDAADFVLLKQDLDILREGIDEGRATFANTLKYILTTISANFGNMFSMAGASLLLPFLPLLAPQILLNNFLSDIPATTIAGDNVDPEWVAKPRRWNTIFIRDYMVLFGLVSSIFDFLAFGVLLFVFRASPVEFRTGWFIESLLTELVIALVVRTRHLFFRSRPGTLLLVSHSCPCCPADPADESADRLPEMTISTDNTDPEMVDKPTRWNIDFIRKFMLVFGPLSSVFDYATFAVLLYVLHATEQQFRTGWFMESVISAALIVLVVRTRRPFLASRPSKWLAAATAAIVAATFLFPYTALAGLFGFAPLPLEFIVTMGLIVVAYILAAELAKAIFYRKVKI